MAILDEILAFNGRTAPLPDDPKSESVQAQRKLCVITCVDPRLVRFSPAVLGLDRGDAALIRLPGGIVTNGHADALRAVAATVYINRATEILILGHTDCGTTRIDTSTITAEMQRRGVRPESMPGGVREFLGAVGDLHQALKASAAAIRAAPFLPKDLLVHCAILDIHTGVVEVVDRGEPYLGQAAANASGDMLAYTAGPSSGSLSTILGSGEALLASSGASLFSGATALAAGADPFSSAAVGPSTLPVGWADGAGALTPTALPAADPSLGSGTPPAAAIASSIDLGFRSAPQVVTQPGTPDVMGSVDQQAVQTAQQSRAAAARPSAAPMPQQKTRAPRGSARPGAISRSPVDPVIGMNLTKVRDFYRLEFTLDQRKRIAKQLATQYSEGASAEALVKTAIKPVLDAGQKRYKVIDELISLKERLAPLRPQEVYSTLSQLFE